MIAFFIVMICVIWGMLATTGLWLASVFPMLGLKWPVLLLPSLLTAFIVGGMAFSHQLQTASWWNSTIYYGAYILFGFAFLAFCTTAFFACLQWLAQLVHLPVHTWLGWCSIAVTSVLCAVALWNGFSAPSVKHIPVQAQNLPKMKWALISDTHLGTGVSLQRFDRALQQLENEKPDLVLVLGDIFEYGPHREQYAARLKKLSAPLGVYGVMGNHEYYNGLDNAIQFYKEAGIVPLQNEMARLPNGLQIAGVKDIPTTHVTSAELTRFLSQADPQQPLILLSHTPLLAEEAAAAGTDFMFSGHTHNGQIFPFNWLVNLRFPRAYGLFDVNGMQFYITSGMFYWGIPLRLGAPAEIPIIEVN